MPYSDELRAALDARLQGRVRYLKGWDKDYTGAWKGPQAQPVALLLHHTAGAATDSTDANHPGNQTGANNGVIRYVQNHFKVPAANFTLDRDGTLYTHAANPVWHAGEGTFTNKSPWSAHRIPRNDGNRWMLGVEVVSKGRKKDYLQSQIDTLVELARACRDASEWADTSTLYLPRHKDWAGNRKVDIVYSNDEVQQWFAQRPEPVKQLWDGKVPEYEAVIRAQNLKIANPASYRLACRLFDLGFFRGAPAPRFEQGYPRRAVKAYQEAHGYKVPVPGNYGPVLHKQLFGGAR